jgi:hypothetical protein
MDRGAETMHEGVVLLDAGIVHDIATTLSGSWQPAHEDDAGRRAELVAAARLRIFADRDSYGVRLAATPDAREAAMVYDEAMWSVGFIEDISTTEGAPAADDVAALEQLLTHEGISSGSARTLAYAVLDAEVTALVTPAPEALRHQRHADLPPRVEILTPIEAVERLGLVPGEIPVIGPPPASAVATGPTWWLP